MRHRNPHPRVGSFHSAPSQGPSRGVGGRLVMTNSAFWGGAAHLQRRARVTAEGRLPGPLAGGPAATARAPPGARGAQERSVACSAGRDPRVGAVLVPVCCSYHAAGLALSGRDPEDAERRAPQASAGSAALRRGIRCALSNCPLPRSSTAEPDCGAKESPMLGLSQVPVRLSSCLTNLWR